MVYEDRFRKLQTFAGEVQKVPELALYAEYCRLRLKGLRQPALNCLSKFLDTALVWDFSKRKDFATWYFHKLSEVGLDGWWAFPFPLAEKLIKTTLLEWRDADPENHLPYRWLGLYFHNFENYVENLRKAVQLSPEEQEARVALVRSMVDSLGYLVHHIPDGYLGDNPEEDLLYAEEARKIASKIENHDARKRSMEEIDHFAAIIKDWKDYIDSNSDDFISFCKDRGHEYEFPKSYYYKKQ